MHTFRGETIREKIVIVICEGPSEVAYLNELSRMFREEEIPIKFCPKSTGGGHYSAIRKVYKDVLLHQRNLNNPPIIWADKDIYTRNDSKNGDSYANKEPAIPDFYFNHYNFEDMFILHYSLEQILQWQQICEKKKHFSKPLHAIEYMPLFKEHVFSEYEKGTLPTDIFSMDALKNAFANNNNPDIKFKSDFLKLLENLLTNATN